MKDYEDFEIAIDPLRDGSYPVRIRTERGQEFRDRLILPTADARYQSFQYKLEYQELVTEDDIMAFGELLHETLFHGMIWGAFQAARVQAQARGNALRIRLSIEPDEVAVASLPWEFVADDAGLPLAIEHSFCRYIPRIDPIRALRVTSPEVVKVIITSALPSEVAIHYPLDLDAEIAGIRQSLQPLVDSRQIEMREVPHLTGLKLQRLLEEERPHIIHHIGHGTLNGDMGFLVLETDAGTRKDVSARQLGVLFRGSTVRLVVLNACKTSQVITHLLRGIAPALISANIPAVVGMQSSVLDQTGRMFAEAFYRALARGFPIDGCVAAGRKAIIAEGISHLDWGLATLYMRAPDGRIFTPRTP
jgi:hypothetical protein